MRQGLRRPGLARSWVGGLRRSKTVCRSSPPARALAWIRANELPTGGIRVHSGHTRAYAEVTGYLVPTLLQYGERELAMRLSRWLVCIQRPDGAYADPDHGTSYVFDTGQVLRGLLAVAELVPQALRAAQRAAEYLLAHMVDEGKHGFGARHSSSVPESVHLYVLPPLLDAAEVLQKPEYGAATKSHLKYYCDRKDALQIGTLTHFLGYELEALIDLGRADLAMPVLDLLRQEQATDGSVRGVAGETWTCSPGLAQLAICWYKTGHWEAADRALAWLDAHQQPSGGFPGSCGPKAAYFPHAELSWAAKFYLDAHLLRVKSFFERNAHTFSASVSPEDGRAQAILSAIQPHDRVLEVGCGKGRFLQVVRDAYPGIECTGVDISPALLAHLPPGIRALPGSLESVPCPDDGFDVVFSVEAIAHSPNPVAAVAEMIRVTRPGGSVIIIDKQESHWGQLDCPLWERWPEATGFSRLLNKGCDHVKAEPVGYDGRLAPDGLMVAWRGQKRFRLSEPEWEEVLISPSSRQVMIDRIRHNHLSEWSQVILLATALGEKVLEVGSGTGEISLHLAQAGRLVTALDYSADSLAFTRRCAEELGMSITTVHADATQRLPFSDKQFNCTWSSGLLEHFAPDVRRKMLREWGRITDGKVIALVPNAACVAYRAGKTYQEEHGTWPYGLETPILSLRDDFEAAGLEVITEYSVGAKHALTFLPADHPLRKALSEWMDGLSSRESEGCNQGYLLVTVGAKQHGK